MPSSVFNSQASYPQGTQPLELKDRDGGLNNLPTIQEETVSNLLLHLDCHKSMGPNGIHPRVVREPAKVIAEPLSIIYQHFWSTVEDPDDCRLANVTHIYMNEDPGNYGPVSMTSVLEKVIEQIVLTAVMWRVRDNQEIRPSQLGFMKNMYTYYHRCPLQASWLRVHYNCYLLFRG